MEEAKEEKGEEKKEGKRTLKADKWEATKEEKNVWKEKEEGTARVRTRQEWGKLVQRTFYELDQATDQAGKENEEEQ